MLSAFLNAKLSSFVLQLEMGVPELLKFVARAAPGALCRIPRGSDTFCVDYALVDCTNAIQTLGMPVLLQFLTNPNVRIRCGIIFVLDGQRRRIGTSREQRGFS